MFHWVSPLPLLSLTEQSLWSLPIWLTVCFRPPDDMLSYSNILESDHHHHCCCCNRHSLTSTTFVSFLSAEVKMILKELRSLTRRLREKDEEDLIINDWKFGNLSCEIFQCLKRLNYFQPPWSSTGSALSGSACTPPSPPWSSSSQRRIWS